MTLRLPEISASAPFPVSVSLSKKEEFCAPHLQQGRHFPDGPLMSHDLDWINQPWTIVYPNYTVKNGV